MKARFLINPFTRIAGYSGLFIGLTGMLLTTYFAYITGTHFLGVLKIDFAKDSDYWVYLVESGSHWLIFSTLIYVSGVLFSTARIRAIDVFGTILFSRLPLIITPVFRFLPYFKSFAILSAPMYIILGIYLITIIWTLILFYNAIKVSCNFKKGKLIAVYVVCIIISEIITRLLLFYQT